MNKAGITGASLLALAVGNTYAEPTNVTWQVNNPTNLVWELQQMYWLGTNTTAGGTVTGTPAGYRDKDSQVTLTPHDGLHHQFNGWENGPAGMESDVPLEFLMDQAYTNIIAKFARKNYGVGVSMEDQSENPVTNAIAQAAANILPGSTNYLAETWADQSIEKVIETKTKEEAFRVKGYRFK